MPTTNSRLTVMAISEEEKRQRAEAARQIRHSTEMEGGRTDDVARAMQDEYVRGEIDGDELIAKIRQRNGLE